MAAWSGVGRRGAATRCVGFLEEGSVTLFHEGFAVAFVGGDGAGTASHRRRVVEGRHALEFAEDGVLVGEEIADEAHGVFLFHGEGGLRAWAEDASRQSGGEVCDVLFVGGGEVNQAREVVHAGVESRNVTESQLR